MNIFGPRKRQDNNVDNNSFNREDSTGHGNDAYKAFTKDKRMRTTVNSDSSSRKVLFSTDHQKEDSDNRRRSYNPNFSADNKFRGGGRFDGGEKRYRSYDNESKERRYDSQSGERRSYNRFENSSNQTENFERGNNPYRKYDRPQRNHSSYKKDEYRPKRNFHTNNDGEEGNQGFQNKYADKHLGKRNSFGDKKRYPKKESKPTYNAENYPKFPAPEIDEAIRLNKFISMSGICSRREADEYITEGRVSVNDVIVTEMGIKIQPKDVVKIDGKVIENEKKVYIVMNKPKGYVTSLEDPHADKTVMDLLKNACKERIYPVGRLDKSSLGVLLFTNDGDLAKQLTHPSYEKKKVYHVTLDKPITKADMEQIVAGITLEDGEIHADEISYVGEKKNEVGIEIHSGRNRIVRRIFDHMGYRVNKLDRVYFAGLTKLKLKRGAWRFLTPREVGMLKSGSYE